MARQFADLGLDAPDYIFCTTHRDKHWHGITHLLAPEGAIGIIEQGPPLDISLLMRKCASLHTEFMFARAVLQTKTIATQHRTLEAIAHLIDNGTLRTTATENYGRITAANLRRAHAALEATQVRGKIVLEGF
jgi:NADPH:quinone reductase-like Zn-dependent oxidoreductase